MSRSEDDLTFTVSSHLKDGTFYRFISKSVNVYVARAAFHMAMIQYPNDRLMLKHGSLIIGDTERGEGRTELPMDLQTGG
jgi:hypothetical protein